MKKTLILLLLVSFCGGTAEPLFTSVEQKQILEEESKLVKGSEDSVNSIFWGELMHSQKSMLHRM